VQSYNYQVGQ